MHDILLIIINSELISISEGLLNLFLDSRTEGKYRSQLRNVCDCDVIVTKLEIGDFLIKRNQ